jgi:hypothetical protein
VLTGSASVSGLVRMAFVSFFLLACGVYISRSRAVAEFYAAQSPHSKNAV